MSNTDTKQAKSFRPKAEHWARCQAIAQSPGLNPLRASINDVMRLAITLGLELLEGRQPAVPTYRRANEGT